MTQDSDRVSAWLHAVELKVERSGNALLRDAGITVTQLRVLKYLTAHPDAAQVADLSAFFGVTHTSMVHVVNSLEEKGYVRREPAPRGRGRRVVLTQEGRRLTRENEGRIDRVEEAMTDGLTQTERAQLLNMLRRMDGNLDRHFGR